MFRISLLVSLLFFCFLDEKQAIAAEHINSLNFADAALSKCIKEHAQANGWVTAEEVTKLKCHGMDIKNIEGINVFTQLTSLSLFNNELQSVDLSSLNDLEAINIADNKLQNINITGLSKVTSLYLFKNELTTVDFTGLSQLKKLRITNNQLNKVDISSLVALEKAYFFDNKLEDLIVKGLPKLKFIELRQNPMPDEVYDRYDELEGITIVHDGNADDWK